MKQAKEKKWEQPSQGAAAVSERSYREDDLEEAAAFVRAERDSLTPLRAVMRVLHSWPLSGLRTAGS